MSTNPNTVKSQDELNEGGRKSDVLVEAISKLETTTKELEWTKAELKKAKQWLIEIAQGRRFTPTSMADSALIDLRIYEKDKVEKLEKENAELKSILLELQTKTVYDEISKDCCGDIIKAYKHREKYKHEPVVIIEECILKRLQKQLAIAVAGLQYYANEDNYIESHQVVNGNNEWTSEVALDNGVKARCFLKKIEELNK